MVQSFYYLLRIVVPQALAFTGEIPKEKCSVTVSTGFAPELVATRNFQIVIAGVLLCLFILAVYAIRRPNVKGHPILRIILIALSVVLFVFTALHSIRAYAVVRHGFRTYYSCPTGCPCISP